MPTDIESQIDAITDLVRCFYQDIRSCATRRSN